MARPAPITDDPIYRGCANQRYGPDAVTSRALLRCPAAQIRITSPATAIEVPTTSEAGVGAANQKTSAPAPNPNGTRLRASASARRARHRAMRLSVSDTTALGRQTPLHGAHHFVDLDIHQTHRRDPAAAQMMTLAHGVARHGDVGG